MLATWPGWCTMQTDAERLRQQIRALKTKHADELAKLGQRVKALERHLGLSKPDAEPVVVLRSYERERLDLPLSWEVRR
jgi:hypothetical protein